MKDETMQEHYDIYRSAFDGRINLSDLKRLPSTFANAGSDHALFVCPCGGTGHVATAAMDYNTGASTTMSPVVHCHETGKQWLMTKDVARAIRVEEDAYFSLLKRFDDSGIVGRRVDAAEAFRLHTEKGVPHELLEIDGVEAFGEIMEEHRRRSSPRTRSYA